MKTILVSLLIGLMALAGLAQTTPTSKHHKKKDTNDPPATASAPATPPPDPTADLTTQVHNYQKAFVPTDPWRIINEKTNFARGSEWVQFEGTVTRATASGITLQGWYEEPLAYMLPNHQLTSSTFILSNYPRHVSVGQTLSRNDRLVALKAETKDGLPNLDYGTVWVPELTEEQKAQAAQAKTKIQSKVLAFHQELADKGDAYGEYKMGMHYLNGEGVDKDLAKAKDFFTKSAAQGNADAKAELAKLPAN